MIYQTLTSVLAKGDLILHIFALTDFLPEASVHVDALNGILADTN